MVENPNPGIDPEKLSTAVIRKTFKESDPESAALLPVYRVRWWGYTEKWRANSFIIDVLGCNEDCTHCFVPIPLLRADVNSPEFQKKLQKLPKSLQKFPQSADNLFNYAFNRFKRKYGTARGGVIELNGGEPTLYPAAIKRLGELCKKEKMILGVNTNGFAIATREDFLDRFDGLKDTIAFMVSIKGTTPEEFRRFSGAKGEHYLTPFEAARRIQDKGFRPARLGITVDTIAAPTTMEKDLRRLIDLLNKFNLRHEMINMDVITEKIFSFQFPTVEKMIKSGYYERKGEGIIRHTDPKMVMKRLKKIM